MFFRNAKEKLGLIATTALLSTSAISLVGPVYLSHLILLIMFIVSLCLNSLQHRYRLTHVIILLTILTALNLKSIVSGQMINFERVAQYLLFFTAILLFRNQNNVNFNETFIKAIKLTSLINCIVLTVDSYVWIKNYGFVFLNGIEFFRLQGIFNSPVESATFLLLGFAVIFATSKRSKIDNIFLLVLLFFLIISFSRAAYIGLLIILLYYLIKGFYQLNRSILIRTTLFIFSISLIFLLNDELRARVGDIGDINFNINRFLVWEYTVKEWTKNSLTIIFGMPLGYFDFFHPIDRIHYNNIHGGFLDIIYNFGIFGIAILLIIIPLIILKCKLSLRQNGSFGEQYVLIVIILGAINLVDTIYLGVCLFLIHAFVVARIFDKSRDQS